MEQYTSTQIQQIKEIGQRLYRQRLKNSVSLEQLATTTFIRSSLLKALEEGEVEKLPELVYVQGFIRRYGDAVQLDGYALAQQITVFTEEQPEISSNLGEPPIIDNNLSQKKLSQAVHNPKKASVVASQPKTEETSGVSLLKSLRRYWLYLLILGGAIGGGLFYSFTRPPASETVANNSLSQTTKTSETKPQQMTKSPAILKRNQSVASENASSTVKASPVSSETSQKPVIAEENSSITETSEGNDASSSPQTSLVKADVTLENDSWFRVEIDGKPEYEGLLKKGSQQTWTAKNSLMIQAGNAGAVNLSVNNQPAQLLGNLGEVKEITITPDS